MCFSSGFHASVATLGASAAVARSWPSVFLLVSLDVQRGVCSYLTPSGNWEIETASLWTIEEPDAKPDSRSWWQS